MIEEEGFNSIGSVRAGTLLWQPSQELIDRARLTQYMKWLSSHRGLTFGSYEELWSWSVQDLGGFWTSIWEYFEIKSYSSYDCVVEDSRTGKKIEGARWFNGATLNYAEHCLWRTDDHPALIVASEAGLSSKITFAELRGQVAAFAEGLRQIGVGPGDCVVGYLPNVAETVIAALASASIGSTWSSCPPEFGIRSVVDRFLQVEPKVLIVADGYTYQGHLFDLLPAVAEIQKGLPSLEHTVMLPYVNEYPDIGSLNAVTYWADICVPGAELRFEPVPFNHPLYVVYSSGTTGVPKAIVHGHGGVLIEHLKALGLHMNLGEDDRFFWFTTTGWMMWNFLLSGLLMGSSIVLYDGSPSFPDIRALWRLVESAKITCLGVSAPYLLACMKSGITPSDTFDLSTLRTVGSTGAPLPPEGFGWVYEKVRQDILMASVSGGTDVLTAFVMSSPTLPIYAGEMQCRALGCKVESFDTEGNSLIEQVGELVISKPMPSMPVRLLNDPGDSKYHASYFDVYPDVWRHGDWLKITEKGTCIIYGRSDSTLNRSGVRMGTSEFYSVVEDLAFVMDSLVIDTSGLGDLGELLLFVVLDKGVLLDVHTRLEISEAVRLSLSPRHVPNAIYSIEEIPRTLNGKKVEVPVKKILSGTPPRDAVSFEALANPEALQPFIKLGRQRSSSRWR